MPSALKKKLSEDGCLLRGRAGSVLDWRDTRLVIPSQVFGPALHSRSKPTSRATEAIADIAWQSRRSRARSSRRESALESIRDTIEASRYILELAEDYDGEGSRPYRCETWDRSARFVYQLAMTLYEEHGVLLEPPRIEPGPEGSIDIHWKTPSYELLINVPEGSEEEAQFYGDDYARRVIKGRFPLSAGNTGLLFWLSDKA